MESHPVIVSVANKARLPAACLVWPSSPCVRTTRNAGARPGARAVGCALAKDSMLYALEHDELFNSPEVIQWETGKCFNSIAAAQGISIRRRFRTRYPASDDSAEEVPRSTLERIIWDKEVEVFQSKAMVPLRRVMHSAQHAPPPRDFIGALVSAHRRNNAPAVIAEVNNDNACGMAVEKMARACEKNGAACLSVVVTNGKHFQGSFDDLETLRNSDLKWPLLCKDFIIDVWQVYHARSKGADAILLIAAVLPDIDIKYMLRICHSLGMTALIEVQGERELDRVLKIDGVHLIGINSHNLDTSQAGIETTKMLLETRGDIIRKKRILVVTESGQMTPEDVKHFHDAGVCTALVEKSLAKKGDPGRAAGQC